MAEIQLFPREQVVGIFRGFQQGGMEFHADLVLPYRNEFQNIPMHGQFLIVQLETPDEAVLGRIASFSSEGKLSFGSGEEFNIRAVREERPIPEDLREQYLKYRINIRVLGVLRKNGNGLTFVPSHRRLPHVGSKVAFPSAEVLREIAGHNIDGAPIGHLAFGEYIYAAGNKSFQSQEWMQVVDPEVLVRFPIESLVSRRSFIFARAGFGKSNLNKLLFSKLYENTPFVTKRAGKQVLWARSSLTRMGSISGQTTRAGQACAMSRRWKTRSSFSPTERIQALSTNRSLRAVSSLISVAFGLGM